MVIRVWRYRTPNGQSQTSMHEALIFRLRACPVHLQKSEVEAMGLERVEAARLFDKLKGVSCQNDCVSGQTPAGAPPGWERSTSACHGQLPRAAGRPELERRPHQRYERGPYPHEGRGPVCTSSELMAGGSPACY